MAFTQSFRRIESQLLPRRVEVERYLGYLEHSTEIPAVSSLSPSAHELSLSSSIDLSSIKQSGESSYSRTGVRGLGVDNLEEGQLDFYNTHRRVTFGRNRRKPKYQHMADAYFMVIGFRVVSVVCRQRNQDRQQAETYMGIRFPVPGVA